MSRLLIALWIISPFALAGAKLIGLISIPWLAVATTWAWLPLAAYAAYCLFVFNS